jgi:thiamine-monophosphate kinase
MDSSRPLAKGERAFLRRLQRELGFGGEAGGLVPFGDDMATLDAASGLLWTTDTIMEGVDFDPARHGWYEIGRKAMAVSLSDCAAMAVVPVSALCSAVLCSHLSMDDALHLMRGVREMGERFGCPVLGGDTNSWEHPTAVTVSVAARAEPGCVPVLRSGARVGDRVFLTGPVGGSILGRHMSFEPRVRIACEISRSLRPHAMIDISDGLAVDLWHILEASGCGAEIQEAELRQAMHPDAHALAAGDGGAALRHALGDGEDFELIVAVEPQAPQETIRRLGLLPLGRIVAEEGLWLVREDGKREPVEPVGWEHFR